MTAEQINSICRRHRIPVQYHLHFRRLVLDYLILSPEFGRLTRRNPKFKKCLEDILDLLSEHEWFFDVPAVPLEIS